MARARNIKPDFCLDEDRATCSLGARLLLVYLPTIADKEGRLEDRPLRIRACLFPYENHDIDSWLTELESKSQLLRYDVGGVRYIQILGWKKSQDPHYKEVESEIPSPPPNVLKTKDLRNVESTLTQVQPDVELTSPPDSLSLIPDSNHSSKIESTSKKRTKPNRSTIDPLSLLPPELNDPKFLLAVKEWFDHRSKIPRAPFTDAVVRGTIKFLIEIGPARAIPAIDRSIRAGWRDIYEEKSNGNGKVNGRGVGQPSGQYDDDPAPLPPMKPIPPPGQDKPLDLKAISEAARANGGSAHV